MSDKLIIFLMLVYIVILALSLFEKNYARAEYWLGALIIVHATLRLK